MWQGIGRLVPCNMQTTKMVSPKIRKLATDMMRGRIESLAETLSNDADCMQAQEEVDDAFYALRAATTRLREKAMRLMEGQRF